MAEKKKKCASDITKLFIIVISLGVLGFGIWSAVIKSQLTSTEALLEKELKAFKRLKKSVKDEPNQKFFGGRKREGKSMKGDELGAYITGMVELLGMQEEWYGTTQPKMTESRKHRYVEVSVKASFKNITIENLVRFLYYIQSDSRGAFLKELKIRRIDYSAAVPVCLSDITVAIYRKF